MSLQRVADSRRALDRAQADLYSSVASALMEGLSVAAVAESAQVSESTIRRWPGVPSILTSRRSSPAQTPTQESGL